MATVPPAASDEQESAMLDRVLNRLVRTDDDKISAVLQKLLPMLVRKLNEGPAVRGKVINILSHISKRARPNTAIVLPCVELLEICRDVPPTSFAFNFALTFLEMGVLRLPPLEQGIVAAKIAHGISRMGKYSQPQNILLNTMLAVLHHLPLRGKENMHEEGAKGDNATTGHVEGLGDEDLAVVIDWFLDICLYRGILTREGSVYHGLSSVALARLTLREKAWPSEVLTRRKLAVIRALKSDLITAKTAATPALAAACDTHHEVVKAAEDFLKSLSSSGAAIALGEDSSVALNVLNLILGGTQKGHPSRPVSGYEKAVPVADLSSARAPASPALAVRALTWLETECAGGTAARISEAVRVSFMAMFFASDGSSTTTITPKVASGVHRDRSNEARLRAAGARLAAFVASRCDTAVLPMVGPLVLQAVQRVLTMNVARTTESDRSSNMSVSGNETGGSRQPHLSGPTSLVAIQQTSMLEACYETIASLAGRRPDLFARDTSVPRLLFLELSAREPGLRVKISAALGALKNAYRGAGASDLASELWSLLWDAACSTEHRARLCAVEWACELFDFSNIAARHLCISLCDDKVTAVRSAALRGLSPRQPASLTSSVPASAEDGASTTSNATAPTSSFPSFEDFVLGVLRADKVSAIVRGGGAAPPSVDELPPAALAKALSFALECMDESTQGEAPDPPAEDERQQEALDEYVSLIETTLERNPLATDGQHNHAQMTVLHRSAAIALQRVVEGGPDGVVRLPTGRPADKLDPKRAEFRPAPTSGVAERFASRGQWLQGWLGHEGSIEIRESFAEVTGAAALFMDPNTELVPLLRALGLKLRPPNVSGATGFSNRAVSTAHGAACGVGAILSHLAHAKSNEPRASDAWTVLSEDAIPAALSCASSLIGHPVTLVHLAACGAVGRVGAATALPLPSGTHGTSASGRADDSTDSCAINEGNPKAGPRTRIRGEERVSTTEAVFEKLWASCKLGETTDASRRAEAAAEALGRCCRGARKLDLKKEELTTQAMSGDHSERVYTTLATLFGMARNQKDEELQFAVGAAVADVALSGPLVMPSVGVFESMRKSSIAAQRDLRAEEVRDGRNVIIDAMDYVLYQVMYVLLEDHSPHVSGAAAVYLLAVLQGCKGHPLLGPYLRDIQAAFTRKLTVKSEFVQEVAGKGLALVYEAADGDVRQSLVDSLVDALSTGRRRNVPSATGGVDVHGATHAGAVLSEAGAGAYGEMCAVANDVGRPDLIYSFLSMASHHAAWTTRRGASYSLGVMMKVSTGAFSSQLGRIVPRLFRYRYDPNSKTRTTMEQLWRSIISGDDSGDFSAKEKETIRKNLSAIIAELLRAIGDRKWRDRQSGCAGLADVLRGRSWDQLHPHLEDLWIMADRALDDIKESVAHTAVDFAKTLANISVRLCDPNSFLPSHQEGVNSTNSLSSADAAAAAAARSDTAGQGSDGVQEEVSEARRSMRTMVQDLQRSESEARARGEEGMRGLASGEGRDGAAEEVLRQVLAQDEGTASEGRSATHGDEVAGRALGVGRRERPSVPLTPGRRGAGRIGLPPSAAAREASTAALAIVLPWLLRKGILSRCSESQSLSIRTIQRLVKICDVEALTPHLAELVATLLEGLSALEPQALQYMQFHAETQLEMTQDQMERLRLSMSRAGPLQDALDQCYRHLNAPGVVGELMPRLLGLLRSGTGLATRSASAYLVLSLCERAPRETALAAPRLLATLTNAALSERSSTIMRTYSSALSSVARLASASPVTRLVGRLVQLFREADPDLDERQRRTLALLLGDLCRRASAQLGSESGEGAKVVGGERVGDERNAAFSGSSWSRILPIAFVARHDPDKPVADAFEEAWQEGLTQLQLGAAGFREASRVRDAKDAVLLMLPAVLAEVAAAISSVSRVTKRQGCAGLRDLASTLGSALGEERSGRRLLRRVLSQISGRVWEGKEELLEAVVALCAVSKGPAVSIQPLVWGEAGAVQGARRVKRSRLDPEGPDVEDEESDEERRGADEEDRMDPEMSSTSSLATKAEGMVEFGGEASVSATPSRDAANEPDNGVGEAVDTDETEMPFRYEDKVGDFQMVTNGADGTSGPKRPVESAGEGINNGQHEGASRTAMSGVSRGDAEIEEAKLALDREDDSPVSFGEVIASILPQLKRRNTKFRRDAALSLAALLEAFPECCVYEMVAPTLLDLADLHGTPTGKKGDPIMQARAVSCLAAAWPRMPRMPRLSPCQAGAESGGHKIEEMSTSSVVEAREAIYHVQRKHAASLTRALSGSIRRKVWSVRVPILDALSAVVSRTYVSPREAVGTLGSPRELAGGVTEAPLASIITSMLLADVVQAVEVGAEDAKYSQVRARANSVVAAMTSRKELQLALTPHKEGLMDIARAGAEDGEARVALEGSKALENLMWWP